jgi:hypothetical protein
MALRQSTLALATTGLIASTALAPADATTYRRSSPSGAAAFQRAYALCDARFSFLPKYRGWPQRYLAVEGCVKDILWR